MPSLLPVRTGWHRTLALNCSGEREYSLMGSFGWKSTEVTVPLCPGSYNRKSALATRVTARTHPPCKGSWNSQPPKCRPSCQHLLQQHAAHHRLYSKLHGAGCFQILPARHVEYDVSDWGRWRTAAHRELEFGRTAREREGSCRPATGRGKWAYRYGRVMSKPLLASANRRPGREWRTSVDA